MPCTDLDETLSFFVGQLGFRIEMITPADNPSRAIVSGFGIRLCLELGGSGNAITLRLQSEKHKPGVLHAPNGTRVEIFNESTTIELPPLQETLVVSQFTGDASWTIGRAGMRYRDLIPTRLGGRVIASHIHIPNGGPVPDYVHFHRIKFQMIYCKSGWVRVVYEDQGESFVMTAGDCVLQPPEIRHRVLESSDDLEVIEIGLPAEHETFAEHEIELPTKNQRPDRDFSGQKFVHHIADQTPWKPWRHAGFETRNTGIDLATKGLASAETVRANKSAMMKEVSHQHELFFMFVLSGGVSLKVQDRSDESQLSAGSSVAIPSLLGFEMKVISTDSQLLIVEMPAKFN